MREHDSSIRGVADVGDAKTLFSFRDDGRVAMTVGCNRLTATPEISGTSIRIGPVAGTRMACPPPLEELERKLLAALEATGTFETSASSKSIVFKDANGELQIALSQQE